VPVLFIEPMNGNGLGSGLRSGVQRPPPRLHRESARHGLPVATAPIHLAQANDEKKGFLVLLPFTKATGLPVNVEERRARLAGFAVAVFESTICRCHLQQLKEQGIEVRIFDDSTAGELIYENVTSFDGEPPRLANA